MRLLLSLLTIWIICKYNFAQTIPDSLTQDSLQSTIINELKSFNHFNFIKNNSFILSNANIDQAPVRDFNNLIRLHPSIIIQDGNVHIRGGRADENGYLINGAWATNFMDRSNGVYVIPEMIDQIEVLPGTYSAQYGGANSGLIMTKLKTGTNEYNFNINFQTDKFASKGKEFLGTCSYRDHSFVATTGGPIGPTNHRFFFALENISIGDTQKRFSKGFEFNDLINSYYSDPYTIAYDTVDVKYGNGFTPYNRLDRWAFNGTVNFDFNPVTIDLSGIVNNSESTQNDHPMLDILNDRQYKHINEQFWFTGKARHQLNEKFSYQIQVSHYTHKTDKKDPYFGTNWQKWADSSAVYNATNGRVVYGDSWSPKEDYTLNGFYFNQPGTYELYTKSEQNYMSAAINLDFAFNDKINLSAGSNFQKHTIRNYSIDPFIMAYTDSNYFDEDGIISIFGHYSNILEMPENAQRLYLGNTYGYNVEGKTTESKGLNGSRRPEFASIYLENRTIHNNIEFELGIRWDYLDMKSVKLKALQYVPDVENNIVEKKAESYLNPRIKLTYKPSTDHIINAKYSQNVQAPKFDLLYWNVYNYTLQLHGTDIYYPISLNVSTIKTKTFELSWMGSFNNLVDIALVGYYKQTKNQLRPFRIAYENYYRQYTYISNGAESVIKGLEFYLIRRLSEEFYFVGNYAFTSAKGNASDARSFLGIQDPYITYESDDLSSLDFEHHHNANIQFIYHAGSDKNVYLKNSGLNLLFRFSDGHPYTFSKSSYYGESYDCGVYYMYDLKSRFVAEPYNSSRTDWNYTVDLMIHKTFKIYNKINLKLYCRILNLLNTKNRLNVYETTGKSNDDGFITDTKLYGPLIEYYGGQDYIDMYNAINIENGQAYWDVLGKQLYGHPRQILFGMELYY